LRKLEIELRDARTAVDNLAEMIRKWLRLGSWILLVIAIVIVAQWYFGQKGLDALALLLLGWMIGAIHGQHLGSGRENGQLSETFASWGASI
jgi:hypothetical protein